jgi:carboxylate-amine ligase
VGVEEEYQIVDRETRELAPRVERILPEVREAVGDEVQPELYRSQIEIGTPVCRSLAEVRAELVRLRREVVAAAREKGSRIVAAGTHPFSHFGDQRLTPKLRYADIAADYRQLAREQLVFGFHVHVGIADRDAAVEAMNRARPWLAPLVALSASSPFWLGDDTGYASFRTQVFGRWPTAGTPQVLASRAEYDAVVAALVAAKVVEDGSKIYWDVRPSQWYETIEFRVSDVCPTVDEAVMVAGLARALARRSLGLAAGGEPVEHARPELLAAAKWRASRYGLDGELVDVEAGRAAPAAEVVGRLLEFVRPALEEAGEWDEVSALVAETLARGNGARRQREAYERTGSLEAVVDMLADETERGI